MRSDWLIDGRITRGGRTHIHTLTQTGCESPALDATLQVQIKRVDLEAKGSLITG